jgi:outer membrane protein OmpA-like peptidoglycan-associated protein
VSDPKDKLPPDDFSKTVPNVNLPDSGGESDWDKTNLGFAKQPAADDWGKTVANIRPIDTDSDDYAKTMYPGSKGGAQEVDWGVTRANVNLADTDFGPAEGGGYEKTTPYFQLPEAERQKYQELPPTPTEQAAQEEQDRKAQGGIPSWVWISAGLFSLFLFSILVLLAVWLFFIYDPRFEVTVRDAPAGSDVFVDDTSWGVTERDGSIRLQNLGSGERTIKILHPAWVCDDQKVIGGRGTNPPPILARCRQAEVKQGEDCTNIRQGEEDKAERCYYAALKALPDPFTPEDLIKALNILIINFDTGSFNVPAKRLAALQEGAKYISKVQTSVVLEVGGHTDNVGSDQTNQPLSENRAKAVKDVLVSYGVRPESLQTRGYGSKNPKTSNDTELGRFQNRRIEYSIAKQ